MQLRLAMGGLVAFLAACAPEIPPEEPGVERVGNGQNLLLLTVDTLRADRLGCYGYERDTSPAIDRLAEEGVLFEEALSTSSWTLPALASLFTSLDSSSHGCWRSDSRLSDAYTTLAEVLEEAGYQTGAVASHVFLAPRYGLAQGFRDYDDELVREDAEESHRTITSPKVAARGMAWLDEHRDSPRPWFLWLHFFDPHHRYRLHEEFSTFGSEEDSDRYDGEVAFTSHWIGRVLEHLEGLDLAENTVVVLTADHGEEFGEHGGRFHRRTLYDEVVRVPLLIRAPDIAPRRIASLASLVDVMPTVLSLLEVPYYRLPRAGYDLSNAMRHGPQSLVYMRIAELRTHAFELEAIYDARWKLVRHRSDGHVELYERASDPLERHDRADSEPQVATQLGLELTRAILRAEELVQAPAEQIVLSPEDVERLEALGYGED